MKRPQKITAVWLARLFLLGLVMFGIWFALPRNRVDAYLIERTCGEQNLNDKDRRECMETQLAEIVRQDGPQKMLDVTKELLSQGTITIPLCHGLLHKTGQAAMKASGGVGEAFNVTNGEICAAGYYHGVVELALEDENLTPETVCRGIGEQTGGMLDIAAVNCYHGLGHALMASSNYNLPASLTTCDRISQPPWFHCINGVFMENSSPTHGESQWVKAEDPFYPCNAIDPKYGNQCYHYVPDPLLNSVGGDFSRAFVACSIQPSEGIRYCVEGLSNRIGYLTANEEYGVSQAAETCLTETNPYPDVCIEHVAQTIVYQQASLAGATEFCGIIPGQFREGCAIGAVRTATQFPGITAEARHTLCQSLVPTSARCLAI